MLRYLSLVKFSHTIFALPMALAAWFYAGVADGYGFSVRTLLLVLLCMVAARNAAMGFNRLVDWKIDAANPRTCARDIPAGRVSPRAALGFVVANGVVFVAATAFLNPLALALSPLALGVILGYSYSKRFTWASHFWLGLALGIAPVGAYVAVAGVITPAPVLLACVVLPWVGGFDILYALQDMGFDRANGLHSVPVRLGERGARLTSAAAHLVSVAFAVILGIYIGAGGWYWAGAGIFAGLLALQHIRVVPARFASMNGLSSMAFAACLILDIFC